MQTATQNKKRNLADEFLKVGFKNLRQNSDLPHPAVGHTKTRPLQPFEGECFYKGYARSGVDDATRGQQHQAPAQTKTTTRAVKELSTAEAERHYYAQVNTLANPVEQLKINDSYTIIAARLRRGDENAARFAVCAPIIKSLIGMGKPRLITAAWQTHLFRAFRDGLLVENPNYRAGKRIPRFIME
jgi:hypothetical protein